MFGYCCYGKASKDSVERGKRLQTEHIIRINYQRELDVELIDQLMPAEINLTQRVREVRGGRHQVIRDLWKSALRQLRADDECMQRHGWILFGETQEGVIQVLSRVPEGHSHDG
jgi:hypothetical protein